MKKQGREPFGKAALILACVALVVGATGGAFAAGKIKVKIKNGSVTTKKLKNGAVTKAKLADAAVGANKLGPIQTRTQNLLVLANQSATLTVPCLATEIPISGGAAFVADNPNADIAIRSSFRATAQGQNGWTVAVKNSDAVVRNYVVSAYCLEK